MDEKQKARALRNRKRKKKRIRDRRAFINNYKAEKGCRICGGNDPEDLMFIEWPGPLRLKISYLIKKCTRWETVLERVNKSEVFCRKHAYRHRRTYIIINDCDAHFSYNKQEFDPRTRTDPN